MKSNPFVTALLHGEWLIDNPEVYFHIVESLRNREIIDFKPSVITDANAIDLIGDNGLRIGIIDKNSTVPANSIARIKMHGEIMEFSDWCATGADEIVRQLYEAQSNSNIDATIIDFNTPGGAAKAIDSFREFGKYKTKPVVGLITDALSLGYWAAVEVCDYLIMNGNIASRTGSIGVASFFRDNTKALEEAGIKIHEIYPPESNFKNKDFTEAKKGNYQGLIKNSLSPLAKKFQGSALEKRPGIVNDESVGVLNGAVFFAEDSLKYGLVDAIGDSRMAFQKAKELALTYSLNKNFI